MKSCVIAFLLVLFFVDGFCRNYEFHYSASSTPKVKSENLYGVNSLYDITPDLWQYMLIRNDDRQELNFLKKTDFTQVYAVVPQKYDYNSIVDIVSVEILTSDNGKIIAAKSASENLTEDQKYLLKTADTGTNINIKVNFKFKNPSKGKTESQKIKSGSLVVNVAPGTEAKYPEGFDQLSVYYTEHVFNNILDDVHYKKISLASVKFTINEDGQVTNTQLTQSSTDPVLDKLILEQTKNMPRWIPAKNSDGVKIKQEINIPFGSEGC